VVVRGVVRAGAWPVGCVSGSGFGPAGRPRRSADRDQRRAYAMADRDCGTLSETSATRVASRMPPTTVSRSWLSLLVGPLTVGAEGLDTCRKVAL
jgi:hypothetical protein